MLDILLIEDQNNIAQAANTALSREGWHVALHPDGQSGIEIIRKVRPRMIIIDLMLQNRSGADILGELRADPNVSLALTPVLLLVDRDEDTSALPQADAILPAAKVGPDLCALVRRMLPSGGGA